MKKLLAIALLGFSSLLGAQTAQVQTTPNLITSGTNHTWTGVQTGAIPSNYMPGGPTPKYDPATNTFQFSYGQATVAQTIAINNALANVGAGVKVNGYNYSYEARNMNGDDRQGGVDTFTVTTKMTSNTGSTLLSTSQTHNTKFDWTAFGGTATANTPQDPANLGSLQFSVTGMDSGYWAGYFGPQIRNVSMKLNYGVDPCSTNPAYSPNCANYSTVQTSGNLVPNPGAYAYGGYSIDQSYAINQALGQSGSGVMIHGFQWGYIANTNGPYCDSWFLFCLSIKTPTVTTSVSITDNNGNSIYSVDRSYSNSYNTTNYQYVFPSSRNLSTLGRFNFTGTTNDQGAFLGEMWSKALYTPDPCTVNPLSSTSCSGYQQAYHDQQCSINPLYASDCAGYQQAYLTLQCSANSLYSPSCPGYAVAYHDQQCSVNPLYATDCPGYRQAYHDQQCSLDPLYATDCIGYSQAYHDQQCNINPLFATDCRGYAAAYKTQQCSLNSLYATDCPGYADAYKAQQCSLSALYSSDCTGYAAAYKTQQCSINPLYATDCPGYDQAYLNAQCIRDSLYSKLCEGYKTAYAIKYLAPLDPSVTTAVNQQLTTTVEVAKADPANVVSTTGNTTTDSVLSTPSTTSATSMTSVTSVIAPPPSPATNTAAGAATTPPPPPPPSAERAAEGKKTEGAVASVEKKAGGNQAAAKAAATERAKELANEAGKAATLEAQAATQGLVVGLMGYVPGFSAYQNSIVPDTMATSVARQYHKPTIDNRNAQRRLSGASEYKWQEMVDSQYNLGK
mgnify:FL=1